MSSQRTPQGVYVGIVGRLIPPLGIYSAICYGLARGLVWAVVGRLVPLLFFILVKLRCDWLLAYQKSHLKSREGARILTVERIEYVFTTS